MIRPDNTAVSIRMVGIQGFDVWVAFVQLSLDFFPLSVLLLFYL
jgi:hypothetical protein